ncbi:hypothetical protein [Demequina sp. NBRC 110057]|uniref:hypothetical protein n=1 Tax=Demequina sp. NBRC 110057 TaxID=1570346 RepID=UPI0009FE2F4D|nr:hypothetical protein [Demequina sp. NBRC 110057]
MAQDTLPGEDPTQRGDAREPVAPSKPAFPTTGATPAVPQDVPGEDGDIIAPVAQPDHEEILPTRVTPPEPDAASATPSAPLGDPVHELGAQAVRDASLAASGATPIVTRRSQRTATSESESEARPAWTPGDPRGNAPESAATPDSSVPSASTPPAEQWATDAPVYRPVVAAGAAGAATASSTPAEPAAAGDGSEIPPLAPQDDKQPTPWYRGVVFLTAMGVVVLAAIAYGVYLLLDSPEEVTIAAPEVVEVQAEPTIDPVALEDPSDFLAAMPTTVGAFAMTEAAAVEPDEAGLDTRVAEVDDLVYRDGDTTLTLRAIQHYDETDATEQYDALAADGTDSQPVTVAGTEVGTRATLEGDPTQYVWRNGTAVFVLAGPADALEDFWIQFPM